MAITLQTLLIKLGFDIADIQRNGPAAERQIANVRNAALSLPGAAVPASASLSTLAAAGNAAAISSARLVVGLVGANGAITTSAATTQRLAASASQLESTLSGAERAAVSAGGVILGLSADEEQAVASSEKLSGAASRLREMLAGVADMASKAKSSLAGGLGLGGGGAGGFIGPPGPPTALGPGAAGFGDMSSEAREAAAALLEVQRILNQINSTPLDNVEVDAFMAETEQAITVIDTLSAAVERLRTMPFVDDSTLGRIGGLASELMDLRTQLESGEVTVSDLAERLLGAGASVSELVQRLGGSEAGLRSFENELRNIIALGQESEEALSSIGGAGAGQGLAGLGMSAQEALGAVGSRINDAAKDVAEFDGQLSRASVEARALLYILGELDTIGALPMTESVAALKTQLEQVAGTGKAAKGELATLQSQVRAILTTSTEGPLAFMGFTEGADNAIAAANHLLGVLRGAHEDLTAFESLAPRQLVTTLERIATTGNLGKASMAELAAQVDVVIAKSFILAREVSAIAPGFKGLGQGLVSNELEAQIDAIIAKGGTFTSMLSDIRAVALNAGVGLTGLAASAENAAAAEAELGAATAKTEQQLYKEWAAALAAKTSADMLASSAARASGSMSALGGAAGGGEPPIRRTAQAMGDAGDNFDRASAAAYRNAAAVGTAAKEMDVAANRGSFLNRTLSMAFAFGGGVAVTTVFGFLANAVLGFNSRLEQSHIAFTTLLGDADKANAFITEMKQFAELSPFNFSGLEDAAQRMFALGFSTEQVLPILNAVSDAVAGLGSGQEGINRITLALGQMATAARVNSQDMRQLTEAGIPAWDILAKSIHKSVAETRDLVEKGLIPASPAIEALVRGMEAKFGGLMAAEARTAAGAATTVADTMLDIISGAAKPLYDALATGLVAFADFLINGGGALIVPAIQAIGIAIGGFLIPRLFGLARSLGGVYVALGEFARIPAWQVLVGLSALFYVWDQNIGGVRDALEPLVGVIGDVASNALNLLASTGLLAPAIAAIATVVATRLVVGLVSAGAAMVLDAAAAFALSGAFDGLAVSAGAAAGTTGALGAAAAAAMGPIGILLGLVAAMLAVAPAAHAALVKTIAEGNYSEQQIAAMAYHTHSDLAKLKEEIEAFKKSAASGAAPGGDAFGDFQKKMQDALNNFHLDGSQVIGEAQDLVTQFGQTIEGIEQAAQVAGTEAMTKMAQAIKDGQQGPVDALVAMREAMANQLDVSDEIARLVGILGSGEIEQALASGIPGAVAAAEALRKGIADRLDALTGDAYTAAAKYQEALLAFQTTNWGGDSEGMRGAIDNLNRLSAAAARWDSEFKPSVDASTAAMAALNKQLAEAAQSKIASALSAAFNDIRQTAHRYFDEIHQENLRAIEDAVKHKNAILDAKEALNQAPVTAMQKALDQQRAQIQEWRLRNAIATAQSPEEYRDAVLALQDFLAQQHIDEMQAQADAANDKIDAQKKHNEDMAETQKDAENKRYENQVADFDRQMKLLEDNLIAQHATWQQGEEAITTLLASYGITFGSVGSALGNTFSLNLHDAIAAGVEALKTSLPAMISPLWAELFKQMGIDPKTGMDLLNLGISIITSGASSSPLPPSSGTGTQPIGGPAPPPVDSGGGGAKKHQTGLWKSMEDHLAYIHKDEMVVPPDIAPLMRSVLGKQAPSAGDNLGSLYKTLAEGVPAYPQESMIKSRATEPGGGEPSPVSAFVGEQKEAGATGRDFGQAVSAFAQSMGGRGQDRGNTGNGRLIVKIGDEELADIADHRLAINDDVYAVHDLALGSRR